jgi:hypothetical protein
MIRYTLAAGALAVALTGLNGASVDAQLPPELRDYPLARMQTSGDLVAPFFDGWIANEDGSVLMVFGFMNRNTEELVDIPLGPDNYLEPAQFDGAQPSHFPVYNRRGLTGIRERGAFAVTVPADMAGTEVVWTLKHAGHEYSVPGRATSPAYEMSRMKRARGSMSPAVRFNQNGPESTDRQGIMADRVMAQVGTPVTLSALVQDRGERMGYDVDSLLFPVGTEWIRHQGPAMIEFSPQMTRGRDRDDGEGGASAAASWSVATTQATFSEPGDYVVRLRIDNFMAPDSKFDNQCCWTNAYIPVTVR